MTDTTFTSYPFPRKLNVVMKLGHYRVFDANHQTEDIAAQNAKEALTKCSFNNISKIVYLGFIDKVILSSSETQVDETSNVQALQSGTQVDENHSVEGAEGSQIDVKEESATSATEEQNQPTSNTETST